MYNVICRAACRIKPCVHGSHVCSVCIIINSILGILEESCDYVGRLASLANKYFILASSKKYNYFSVPCFHTCKSCSSYRFAYFKLRVIGEWSEPNLFVSCAQFFCFTKHSSAL